MANPPADATEIMKALARWSKSDYHVKAIVQYLLDTHHFFPTPSMIRDAADQCPSQPPPKYRPVNPDCADCNGSGFVLVPMEGRQPAAGMCLCRVIGAPMPPSLKRDRGEVPDLAPLVESGKL
jgi:hypothetical protein